MSTEYQVRLDRSACDGVFACLVRDDRFVEASDGLATIDEGDDGMATVDEGDDGSRQERDANGEQLATFTDERLTAARQAARACPVDAIEVLTEDDDE